MIPYDHSAAVGRARLLNWASIQKRADEMLQVYEGDYRRIMQRHVRGRIDPGLYNEIYAGRYEWRAQENVLKRVVEQTIRPYAQPAIRAMRIEGEVREEGETTVADDPGWAEAMDRVDSRRSLDSVMAQGAAFVEFLGLVLVRPWIWPLRAAGAPKRGREIRWQVLTPDRCTPIVDPEDAGRLAGVVYSDSQPDDLSERIGHTHVWSLSADGMRRHTNGRITEPGYVELSDRNEIVTELVGAAYPYRVAGDMVLPFGVFSLDAPPFRIVNESAGESLFNATIVATQYAMLKEWVLRSQSHLQIAVVGEQSTAATQRQIMDPTIPFFIPNADKGEAEVKVLDLQANPEALERAIQHEYEREASERGFTLEELTKSAQRQSGEAQRMQNLGKSQFLQNRIMTCYRPAEHSMATAIRAVWNADADPILPRISSDAEFSVDFGDPYQEDPLANIDEKLKLIDRNVQSVGDWMRDLDPDLHSATDEDVLDRIRRNRKINGAARGLFDASAQLADLAPPPNLDADAGDDEPELEDEVEENLEATS